VQQNFAAWPGVPGIFQATYTASHGISAGTGQILCALPPAAAPAADFLIGDVERIVTVKGCKILDVQYDRGDGEQWTIHFADRRWKWATLGRISGSYNQLDTRGKLVPSTIRSPEELIELCLEAMGETDYVIQAPPGLASEEYAENEDDYLQLGEDTPVSFVNVKVDWEDENPAQALARLADTFALRVVYDPVSDKVLVVPAGQGAQLPVGFRESRGANIDVPAVPPGGIGIVGAPVKYQVRLLLEAVALEWSGGPLGKLWVPLDKVSYAPRKGELGRERPWDFTGPGLHSDVIPTDELSFAEARALAAAGVFRGYRLKGTDLADDGLLQIPGFGEVTRRLQVMLLAEKVELVVPTYKNANVIGTGGQTFVPHGEFYDGYARAKPPVVYGSAVNLIQSGIWKDNRSENSPKGERLNVPFQIDPVQQMILFDRPVYFYETPEGEDVAFLRPPPKVVMETAVYVKDILTGVPDTFLAWQATPTGGIKTSQTDDLPEDPHLIEWHVHPDVESPVVNTYTVAEDTDDHEHDETQYPDQDDALSRCEHYLASHWRRHQLTGGETATYAGVWEIKLDGAVAQVSWSIGPGGPTTVASRNTEHAVAVLPYPARRRAENLAPDPFGALQNRLTRNGNVAEGAGKALAVAVASLRL
jgi:hypothetical protein